MRTALPYFLYVFCRKRDIRIDLLKIREVYMRHPLSHDIRSLSDTLDELHIRNMECQLSFDELVEIEEPLIVEANVGTFPFCIVERTDPTRQRIRLLTPSGRHLHLSFDDFRSRWDGMALLAEKGDEPEIPNLVYRLPALFCNFLDRHWRPLLSGAIAVLVTLLLVYNPEAIDLRFLLKAAGATIALLALRHTLLSDETSPATTTQPTDRYTTLLPQGKSKFGQTSCYEWVLTYFLTSLFWGLVVAYPAGRIFLPLDIIATLFLLGSLIGSLRSEYRVWNIASIGLATVILADLACEWFRDSSATPSVEPAAWAAFVMLFLVLRLTLHRIILLTGDSMELARLRYLREQLLSDPECFFHSLARQPQEPLGSDDASPVSNYREEAEHTVTVILDPTSPSSISTYRTATTLMTCRLNLIFRVNENDPAARDIALQLISAGIREEWPKSARIISDWFERHILPQIPIHSMAEHDLHTQQEYCRHLGIEQVPAILVDDRRLPVGFCIDDLKVLL